MVRSRKLCVRISFLGFEIYETAFLWREKEEMVQYNTTEKRRRREKEKKRKREIYIHTYNLLYFLTFIPFFTFYISHIFLYFLTDSSCV